MTVGVGLDRLGEAVDEIATFDVMAETDAALVDTFIELRRQIDRLECTTANVLASIEGRRIPYGAGAASAPAWAQWQTGQRWQDAKASFDAGLACEQLPLTAKAWADGEISASAARTICRGIKAGHEDVYVELEAELVAQGR